MCPNVAMTHHEMQCQIWATTLHLSDLCFISGSSVRGDDRADYHCCLFYLVLSEVFIRERNYFSFQWKSFWKPKVRSTLISPVKNIKGNLCHHFLLTLCSQAKCNNKKFLICEAHCKYDQPKWLNFYQPCWRGFHTETQSITDQRVEPKRRVITLLYLDLKKKKRATACHRVIALFRPPDM